MANTASIDQVNRQFVPRTSLIRTGTAVQCPNSDNIRRSAYSFSPTKVFTLKLYAGKPTNPLVFDKWGVVVLGCDIHDHRVAWLLVVDTPYYTQTDGGGAATLPHLPPGNYTLRAWHAPMSEEEAGETLLIDAGAAAPRTLRIEADTNAMRAMSGMGP